MEGMRTGLTLRIPDHVHFVQMDDQFVVADMRSGRYLGLEGVGARVWNLIREHATRDRIVESVHAEYDVPMDVLERDVERLVQDLLERRLVEEQRTT